MFRVWLIPSSAYAAYAGLYEKSQETITNVIFNICEHLSHSRLVLASLSDVLFLNINQLRKAMRSQSTALEAIMRSVMTSGWSMHHSSLSVFLFVFRSPTNAAALYKDEQDQSGQNIQILYQILDDFRLIVAYCGHK